MSTDLTPAEREALLRVRDEIESADAGDILAGDDADFIARSVRRFLAAVPRLAGEQAREAFAQGVYWAWFNNYCEALGAKFDYEGYITNPDGIASWCYDFPPSGGDNEGSAE